MRFIANPRRNVIEIFARSGVEFHGYLLSTHRITPAALEDAATPRRYVRLAQIIRGLLDGARDAEGAFECIHCGSGATPDDLSHACIGLRRSELSC